MRASQLLQKRIRYRRSIIVTMAKGYLICLLRSQGNPMNGTRLYFPGGFFGMPKGLGKLPLPKATHDSQQ